jgi:hypothetical protein
MSTLETQYRNYLKENPSSTVDFNLWKVWHGNQIKQALVNMMEKDEELGLYDYDWCKGNVVLPREEIKLEDVFNDDKREGVKKFIHEVKSIPKEEILANRCNAYKFLDFDKQETKELNPYIGPFLLKNGFMKQEDNVYTNPECTIVVFDSDYQIDFIDPQHGPVTMYTSWSIPHLVGTLTWHDLIDKNYNK